MSTQPIMPVVPPPVSVAENQPQNPGIEAAATTNSPEDLLVRRITVLWAENTTNRFELGKTLFELQELHACPGSGDFIATVEAIGISKSTAYRLIGHYKVTAGLSQPETDDEGDEEEPQASKPQKVILHLATPQKTKWDLAIEEISKIQGLNKDEAALYAVLETAYRLTHPDALGQTDVSPAQPAQQEAELEELL